MELVDWARSVDPKVACQLRVGTVGAELPPPIGGCNPAEHARVFKLDKSSGQWHTTDVQRLSPDWVEQHGGSMQLFADGSVVSHSWPGSARAGWGVVGMVGEEIVLQAYGPVPQGRLQTAPSAEWAAAEIAALIGHSTLHMPPVVGDCLQVVRALSSLPRLVLAQGGMHSGSLKAILSAFGGRMAMDKVKSHRQVETAVDDHDRHMIAGNNEADASARAGAELHPKPSTIEIQEAHTSWQRFKQLAQAIAKLSAVWPQARRLFGGRLERVGALAGRRGSRPPRPPVPVEDQHDFQPIAGQVLCSRCLCRARGWEAAAARANKEVCPGSSSTMRACMDSQMAGHTLVLGAFGGQPVFTCISCGCYASSRLEGLARVCRPAEPGSKGRQAISRLLRGEHPDLKRKRLRPEAWYRVLGSVLQEFTPGG